VIAIYRGSDTVKGLLQTSLGFYGSVWGGAASFVIVLAAVFFGGDAIAGEFQNKTGYFLMGLPIRRTTVYIGKYIAALMASLCALFLFLVIVVLNGAVYFGTGLFPWQLGLSLLLAILYLVAVLGTTFLFSSLFKTSAYGFVLTAILFLFGFTLLQDLVTALLNLQPWMVISYASSSIGEVFGTVTNPCTGVTTSTVNWGLNGVYGIPGGAAASAGCSGGGPGARFGAAPTWTAGVAESVVILLGYFVVTGIAGLLSFEKEEFA
jgi:ABC-type transport system involved in multi-copper enzyme maturation permease subunit